MTVRGLFAVVWLVGVTAIGAGCVKAVPLDGRSCGCAPGYACCLASNTCVPPPEAARPSCQPPAGPASERADGGDGLLPDVPVTADTMPATVDKPPPDMAQTLSPDMAQMLPPDMAQTLSPDMAQMVPPDMAQMLPPDMAPPPPDTPTPDMPPPTPDMPPRDCSTGARRCLADGRTPQQCSEDGKWETQLVCELRCLDGACTACSPGARRCDASVRPQLCSATGQWQTQASCMDRDVCSGGVCLCFENCDRGTLLNTPVGLVDLAAGSDALWYHDLQKLWRVNPTTGQATEVHAAAVSSGHQPSGGLAADAQGNLFWCRQDTQTIGTEVMRNGTPFLAGACRDLQLGSSHLVVMGENTLIRVPLAGAGGNQVGAGAITAFAAGDTHVFYGYRAGRLSHLYRNTVSSTGMGELAWEQPVPGGAITSVAMDAEHVYFSPGQVLLRLPIAGGQAAIAQESDRYFANVLLTETHIYWTTTELTELGACAGAEVHRRPKLAPGSPHRLIRDEGRCATALVLSGDALYLGTSADTAGLAPGRIIRLAR
jgi:hypothetical protein